MKKKKRAESPKPKVIRQVRENYKLSQTAAADLVESSLRTWQNWESGKAKMHPAIWRWFTHIAWERLSQKREKGNGAPTYR